MKIKSVEFMGSFGHPNPLPEDQRPEVAFFGRSNVGKSSLINALAGQDGLARTSRTPGRTRLVNWFRVEPSAGTTVDLVDLPGYGYAAVDHDTRISHIGYDRKHTTARDSGTWFPLPLMREFAGQGRFTLAKRFHGAPTNRSQRVTLETDAPEILARCRQDQVDAALLVPT